jgi:translation initiation factor 5
MATINIGGDPNDTSYRYKMPKLVTKVEGKGNGIKTVIVNVVDVSKALHSEPAYVTKFFGIDLGATSKYNADIERAVVNGAHTQPDMQELLKKYIDNFILCPTCQLPELAMKVHKGAIKIDCSACGHNGILPTAHKLSTYILKAGKDAKKKVGCRL